MYNNNNTSRFFWISFDCLLMEKNKEIIHSSNLKPSASTNLIERGATYKPNPKPRNKRGINSTDVKIEQSCLKKIDLPHLIWKRWECIAVLPNRPPHFGRTDNASVIYHWSAARPLIPQGLCINASVGKMGTLRLEWGCSWFYLFLTCCRMYLSLALVCLHDWSLWIHSNFASTQQREVKSHHPSRLSALRRPQTRRFLDASCSPPPFHFVPIMLTAATRAGPIDHATLSGRAAECPSSGNRVGGAQC